MSSFTDDSPGGYTASFSNLDTVSAASNSSSIFSSQSHGTVDDIFSTQPASDGSKFSNGPTLPSPAQMEAEEGPALREWRKQNEKRLEEKEKKEKEMLQQIVEEAEEYKREFYRKRQLNIEKHKATNREKEKLLLANTEKFHAEAEKNYWKAISELIPREVPTIEKRGKNKDEKKKPTIVVIQGPKPGKPTDLSRMRHVLLKLKHNPPTHMKPPAPAEANKNGKIDPAANPSTGTSSASAKIATAAAAAAAAATTREAVAVI